MSGKVEDIEKLQRLEELDNTLENGAEAFNNSPIAAQIEDVRKKKEELKVKRDKVDKVFVKARSEVEEVSEKDSKLAASQDIAQKEIEKNQGDYRKVQDSSQMLNELGEERKKVDAKLEELEANFNKIKELKEKIASSIEKLSMQEDDLRGQLEATNVQLKLEMDKATEEKATLEKEISMEALAAYKKARSIVGQTVVAKNENGSCSVCRTNFTGAHLSKIESEAPISVCPNCLRVLV